MSFPNLGPYYWTAEPVGVCSCHYCTCEGCTACGDHEDGPDDGRD